ALKYPVWTAAGSYWNIAERALRERGAGEYGPVPGHAGDFETSIIMALAANEVICERRITSHRTLSTVSHGMTNIAIGRKGILTGVDGVTDASAMATKERGENYARIISAEVAQWLISCTAQMESKE